MSVNNKTANSNRAKGAVRSFLHRGESFFLFALFTTDATASPSQKRKNSARSTRRSSARQKGTRLVTAPKAIRTQEQRVVESVSAKRGEKEEATVRPQPIRVRKNREKQNRCRRKKLFLTGRSLVFKGEAFIGYLVGFGIFIVAKIRELFKTKMGEKKKDVIDCQWMWVIGCST